MGATGKGEAELGATGKGEAEVGATGKGEAEVGATGKGEAEVGATGKGEAEVGATGKGEAEVGATGKGEAEVGATEAEVGDTHPHSVDEEVINVPGFPDITAGSEPVSICTCKLRIARHYLHLHCSIADYVSLLHSLLINLCRNYLSSGW